MFSKVFLFFCLPRMINSKFFPQNAKRQEEKESFYNGDEEILAYVQQGQALRVQQQAVIHFVCQHKAK